MLRLLAVWLICVLLTVPAASSSTAADQIAGNSASRAVLQNHESGDSRTAAKDRDQDDDDGEADRDDEGSADDEENGDEAKSADAKSSSEEAEEEEAKSADNEENGGEPKTKGKKAATKKDAAKKQEKDNDETKVHKVTTKKLRIESTLDGVFVAREMEEVALRPEIWTKFEVEEAVEHGAEVDKGEVLVKFDDAKFEEALADKSLAQRLGELEMMEAEEEFPRFEEAMELAWQEAKRQRQQVLDEYERFEEIMKPLSARLAESQYKNARQNLENAREELEQLEKMYEADEITEETEEIVLKRQRHQVEYYELYAEYAKVNFEYMMDVTLPRREESLKTGLKQSELSFERAKMLKSLGMAKKRYEMEKLRAARARSVEQHAKLLADRSLMMLRAPTDGIVYYGRCLKGRWPDLTSMAGKLKPHGSVSPGSVVMTIVKPRPLYVLASVGEKNFPEIGSGQAATIKPVADESAEVSGEVAKKATAPGSSNKFAVEIEIDSDDVPEWLMPGMTCKAKITVYDKQDAVVVPAELIYSDDGERYVMLVEEDGEEPVRREVEVGKTKDKEVEILDGLEAGDKIVKKKTVKKKDEKQEKDDDKDD